MAPPASHSRLGSVIGGRYRVLSVLGQGGMGTLYVAEHTLTRRRVALKLLRVEPDEDPSEVEQLRARFLGEARAAAAVSHPNIVDVLDMGSDDDGAPFLAMSLFEGTSLDRLLRERGKLSPEQTLRFLLPISGALATLHDAGIVHRDVKPSNIFLRSTARGALEPKLLDFGLAHSLSDLRLTRSGLVMGTPLYMAPEHAAGDDVGPAADVWSLGVVLYECASGELPFNMRERAAVAAQVLAGQIRPLSRVNPTLPAPFAYAIERALRRDLTLRYSNMRELAHSLILGAQAGGVTLPHDPDPIGLPDYQKWLTAPPGSASTTSAAVPALASSGSGEQPSREELANTPPGPVRHGRGQPVRKSRIALAVVAIAALVAGGYWTSTRTGSAPAAPAAGKLPATIAPVPSARPAPVDVVSPVGQGTTPMPEPSRNADALAPRKDAAVAEPTPKPEANAPRRPRKTPAVVNEKPAQPSEPSAPEPKPVAPNPFHVEPNWR